MNINHILSHSAQQNFMREQRTGYLSALTLTIQSAALAAIYKVAQLFCSLFSHSKSKGYELLTEFYWQRTTAFEGKWLFGKNLVNPIVNMENRQTLVQPIDGELWQNVLRKAKEANIPASTITEVNPQEKVTTGICVGMSIEFISTYLDSIRLGIMPRQAFLNLSQKVKQGGSERANLISTLQDKIQTYGDVSLSEAFTKLFRILSSTCSLEIDETIQLTDWNNGDLENLAQGAYLISARSQDPRMQGHVMALIKEGRDYFLLDPDYGTAIIPIENIVSTLKRVLHYSDYNTCTLFRMRS